MCLERMIHRKVYHIDTNQKTLVVILISDKLTSGKGILLGLNYDTTQWSTAVVNFQWDITALNMCVPNKNLTYMGKTDKIGRKINLLLKVETLNDLLSVIDNSRRKKISKGIDVLKCIINEFDLIDIYSSQR